VEGKEYYKLPAEEKWDLLKFMDVLPNRRKKLALSTWELVIVPITTGRGDSRRRDFWD
jgi:hypothetical protein